MTVKTSTSMVPANSDVSAAFALGCSLWGVSVDLGELKRRFGHAGTFGIDAALRSAKALDVKARFIRTDARRLAHMSLPALGRDRNGSFFVLARVALGADGRIEKVLVQSPGHRAESLSLDAFVARWDGSLILLSRRYAVDDPARPFGLAWFFDAIVRYRRVLGEVLIVSFALQLLGLATPLFFQVMIDKVLVNRGLSTLDVIAVGMGIAMTFEVILGGLRSYVFSHTTNRIDVELGARLFSHLVHLPLGYFGMRRVGDSVARVRELENIRSFLTGSTLTSVLDILFSAIILAVIYAYSWVLGLVVTGTVPLYGLIWTFSTPALRMRIKEKIRLGSENQAFLVETITGIETVKAMAAEPVIERKWERQLAGYVRAAFRASSLGVLASQCGQYVSRISTLLILYVGASLVLHEKLTVGELIAVNMLAGQIASPVLRLAQVWQDFQQVKISVERVGDVMNTVPEPVRSARTSVRTQVRGDIVFEDVRFRYQSDMAPAIDGLSLHVPAGQVVGIVGPSGSGKSTLTKLIQRLHLPESGRVLVDGSDLAMIDPAWLRRQVGVVLQESILFAGSIRDNIAFAEPGMAMDRVIAAAQLAGAHDFISRMPGGYDALVGERGGTLSGGQRQRIAIARTLVTNPRILVFDEATSALDLESEQAIQTNMAAICRGRTVLIVAHRLTAVRFAHRIVTIEAGRVVEDGAPADLLRSGGRFADLYAAQTTRFEAVPL